MELIVDMIRNDLYVVVDTVALILYEITFWKWAYVLDCQGQSFLS